MNSLFAICFIGLTVISIQQTTVVLARGTQALLDEHDSAVLNQSCRTDFYQLHQQQFRFSSPELATCIFRRLDYAAPGTRGFWPASICSILRETNSTHLADGTTQCNFQ